MAHTKQHHREMLNILADMAMELSAIHPNNLGRAIPWENTEVPYDAAKEISYHLDKLLDNK